MEKTIVLFQFISKKFNGSSAIYIGKAFTHKIHEFLDTELSNLFLNLKKSQYFLIKNKKSFVNSIGFKKSQLVIEIGLEIEIDTEVNLNWLINKVNDLIVRDLKEYELKSNFVNKYPESKEYCTYEVILDILPGEMVNDELKKIIEKAAQKAKIFTSIDVNQSLNFERVNPHVNFIFEKTDKDDIIKNIVHSFLKEKNIHLLKNTKSIFHQETSLQKQH